MQIFTELNTNKNLSLALGYFDGVHLGHQEVIKSAVNFAKQRNSKSAVITFKDHPCCHFYGVCPKYILSRKQREEKIAELGVDYLYELDFNDLLCELSAKDYLEKILINYFAPISISTGFNHYFGAKKSGNVEFLRKFQNIYGYKYFEISPKKLDNEIISSTIIRNLLQNGDIQKANKMLGYNFSITGKVIEGQKLGRKLGFNTANLVYPAELIDIPFGAYQTEVNNLKAVTNFGIRPTVSNQKQPVIETHILNFNENIYGKTISVNFIKMLRAEQKFNSIEDLKQQISIDINKVENFK